MRRARHFQHSHLPGLLLAGWVLLVLTAQGWAAPPLQEEKPPPGKTRPGEGPPPVEGDVERLLDVLEKGGPPERRIALLALAQRGDFTAVPTLYFWTHWNNSFSSIQSVVSLTFEMCDSRRSRTFSYG